jgi:hypothetical protein
MKGCVPFNSALEESVRPIAGSRFDALDLDGVDSRHRRAAVQPADELLECIGRAGRVHEHASIGHVFGATAQPECVGMLCSAGAKENALDASADAYTARRFR